MKPAGGDVAAYVKSPNTTIPATGWMSWNGANYVIDTRMRLTQGVFVTEAVAVPHDNDVFS